MSRACASSFLFCFFFKQKTAYELRISDWSSDVCSSDLVAGDVTRRDHAGTQRLDDVARLIERTLAGVDEDPGRQDRVVVGLAHLGREGADQIEKIGRASCRERGGQYV